MDRPRPQRDRDETYIDNSLLWFVVGAVCMAAVAGCNPFTWWGG